MKRVNTAIIICTRPESARLPRKVFRKVAYIPAIEHILNRLVGCNIPVILAVPYECREYDHLLNKYKRQLELSIFEGDPKSPLHRMAHVVNKKKIEWIIRITHDDILIDQQTMLDLLKKCKKEDAGYGITPTIVDGAGVEVIHGDNLFHAAEFWNKPTEYISYHVKLKPRKKQIRMRPRQSIERDYRLTMDYEEDWIVLDTVLSQVGVFKPLDDICQFIDNNTYLMNINKLPEMSIYTCAYNSEKYLDRTIMSVLNQTYTDFEYIIVDDGSTDKTPLIISKYINDKRVKFIRNSHNKGLATRSNDAISYCRGRYIMRLDSDDLLMHGSLDKISRLTKSSEAGFFYMGYNEIDDEGNVLNANMNPRTNHHAGGCVMNKGLINEIRFTDGLKHWDSLDLYNRIKNNNLSITYSNQALWSYRKHRCSMSSEKTQERKNALNDIAK